MSFHCLKAYKGERVSENQQIWATYFMDGPFLKFCIWSCRYALHSYTIFYTKFNILYKFYPVRLLHCSRNKNLIMFIYKRNIWFILLNLALFCYSTTFYNKYWQGFFNAVSSTPMNICWLNFSFQPNINIETVLGHQHWIDVILSTFFRRCFVNVETTLINMRRLNFHFQPNINVDSTFMCLLGWLSISRLPALISVPRPPTP